MAAGLLQNDRMFFKGVLPWHGLGTYIPEDKMLDCVGALGASNGDYAVYRKPLFTEDGIKTDHFATVRADTNQVLGVVGPRYRVLQNRDAVQWFQPWIDSGEVSFHTGGTLFDGRKLWFLAQIDRPASEVVNGDNIAKFLMLSNSHDGSTAIRVGFTPIRIVCANTLAMAHHNHNSKLLRIKHTAKASQALDMIRDVINIANQDFEATAEQYRFLATRKVNQTDLKNYVKIMLDIAEVEDKDISTRTKNQMVDMFNRMVNGRGQDIAGVSGTWWAAYNGVNEFFNYAQGNNASNRLNNLWFGQNASLNRKALDSAIYFANAV
jgi:phage/plasmid-like protein (TIGR03299 family)